jgi:hypothetical protein
MPVRPICNPRFYPGSSELCRRRIENLTQDFEIPEEPADLIGGLVPHAGWEYSGAVAAHVWKSLREKSQPRTIIIFGAVHYPGVTRNTVYPEGSWETPIGALEVDRELARSLVDSMDPLLIGGTEAHEQEHSIEVQLPFIKGLFPDCKILPIAVPLHHTPVQLGDRIGALTREMGVIAVGSTDLTHYGKRYQLFHRGTGPAAHEWMVKNDRRILDLIEPLQATEIQAEVVAHHNACGPGAIAASLAFARARGAERGIVLEYTTSYDVEPEGEFETAVGYSGVVF